MKKPMWAKLNGQIKQWQKVPTYVDYVKIAWYLGLSHTHTNISVYRYKTIHLPTNICCSLSHTIKKAEHWRIDAFELWCWRRHLRVPWAARRSNQSILKEISTEYSLEGTDAEAPNTLATWCEELTHWKRPWCWERLKAGGEADNRGWHGWMASPTWWRWVWANSGSWWWTGKLGMLQSLESQRVRHNWATELNWSHTIPGWEYRSKWNTLNRDSCYLQSSREEL